MHQALWHGPGDVAKQKLNEVDQGQTLWLRGYCEENNTNLDKKKYRKLWKHKP